jgi:hypothetical protein
MTSSRCLAGLARDTDDCHVVLPVTLTMRAMEANPT